MSSSSNSNCSPPPHSFIGVDVGSEQVRAALFTDRGQLLASARRPIAIWTGPSGVAEQSSAQIWAAICTSVREIAGNGTRIGGIGFCATCSMVAVDGQGNGMEVTPEGGNARKEEEEGPVRDVLMWMDHRAVEQAEAINAMGLPLLRFTGGRISPEMQAPKLLWLKQHKRELFTGASHFFDLADWCTWRATGSVERSICTVTCKWTYLGWEGGFEGDFFRAIGLGELANEEFSRIGQKIRQIGQPIGNGLSEGAAKEMGLAKGIPVAAGLIDAHSGALGTLSENGEGIGRQMALILGTSACTMSLTKEPIFVPGVWGPYFGVVWPGHWLNEAGMTAFGSALLFALKLHPHYHQMKEENAEMEEPGKLIERLEQLAVQKAGGSLLACSTAFARDLHICPEFLGNRSPDANPNATGAIAGLRMDTFWASEPGLVEWTVATLGALCYGLREIFEAIEAKLGHGIEEIVLSGGMARKSPLLVRLLADISQKRMVVPACPEPVLLGAAVSATVASGHFGTIEEASSRMVASSREMAQMVEPQKGEEVRHFYERKFRAYKMLKKCQTDLSNL